MMILLRLVLLGGILFLIYKAWRLLRPAEPVTPDESFEPTVQCSVCQVHVAKKEAHQKNGEFFCQNHRPGSS